MSLMQRRRMLMQQGFNDVLYAGRILFDASENSLDYSGIPYVTSVTGLVGTGHYCLFHSRNADYPAHHPNNPDESFSFLISDVMNNGAVSGLIGLGAYKGYNNCSTINIEYLAYKQNSRINLPFRVCYSTTSPSIPDTYFNAQTITEIGQGTYSVDISSMPDGAYLMLQVYTLRASTTQGGNLSIRKIWFE